MDDFYAAIVPQNSFEDLVGSKHYTPLPDDWWIGTSDIVGSTKAIADGKYKTVNMVAAAVISAQINAHDGAPFPFIFGGDGAGFAVPPDWKDRSDQALSAVRNWAREEFGIDLRIGMVRVSQAREAGLDVAVAKYKAAEGVNFAMFSGLGLSWAEKQMKAGHNTLPHVPPLTRPNLTGLSCRWSHLPSKNGSILSVVIEPGERASLTEFTELTRRVVKLVGDLDRSGHPCDPEGPGVNWPPAGARLEAHAQHLGGSHGTAWCKALFESFVAWALIKTGMIVGGFDARRYRRVVGRNTDFRKFDDGLKMTLDCDAHTQSKLVALLEQSAADGIIRFGLHAQAEAMMTCIVPSIMTDDHVHFVDGAAGGYTAAAQEL